MQARTHGSDRAAKCLCRIGIADVLEIAQHDHFAIAGREPHDGASQVLHVALADQILGSRGRGRRQTQVGLILEPDEQSIAQQPSRV